MTLTPALQAKKAALEAKGARVSVAPDGSLKWRYPAARAPAVGKETAALDAIAGDGDGIAATPAASVLPRAPRAPRAPPAAVESSGVGALVAVAVGLVGAGVFAWALLRRRRESAAAPASDRSNVVPIRSALH